MTPLQRGLEAWRHRLNGPSEWQLADRALTLQMLRGLAPSFFEQHNLGPELTFSLEALDAVSVSFEPGLDVDRAMSRLDALYLRRVNGLEVKEFDAKSLADYINSIEDSLGMLAAWLMGEQANVLGVTAGPTFEERFPFVETNWQLHLYFLTHLFMLSSDYFLRPIAEDRFAEELEQLERSLPTLLAGRRWDLLAEAQLCLASCGRSDPTTHQALEAAQRVDGSWAESGNTPRQVAHTTSSCLLALAAGVKK